MYQNFKARFQNISHWHLFTTFWYINLDFLIASKHQIKFTSSSKIILKFKVDQSQIKTFTKSIGSKCFTSLNFSEAKVTDVKLGIRAFSIDAQ
jgi:hypothetical protein